MVIVNLEVYGDFDMPSCVGAMLAPELMSKGEVKRIAEEMKEKYKDTRCVDGLIKDLKSLGFYPSTKVDITVGGNL